MHDVWELCFEIVLMRMLKSKANSIDNLYTITITFFETEIHYVALAFQNLACIPCWTRTHEKQPFSVCLRCLN